MAAEMQVLEKEVATLKSDNEGLKGQIQNLREDNQNLNFELTTTTRAFGRGNQSCRNSFSSTAGFAIQSRGWLFTDAEHFPLVYTHKDCKKLESTTNSGSSGPTLLLQLHHSGAGRMGACRAPLINLHAAFIKQRYL